MSLLYLCLATLHINLIENAVETPAIAVPEGVPEARREQRHVLGGLLHGGALESSRLRRLFIEAQSSVPRGRQEHVSVRLVVKVTEGQGRYSIGGRVGERGRVGGTGGHVFRVEHGDKCLLVTVERTSISI